MVWSPMPHQWRFLVLAVGRSMPHHRRPGAVVVKGHLDKWLRTIQDTPKIGNYGASVPAESNSLCDQAKQVGQASDPNCG